MGTGGMRWGAGRPSYRAKAEHLQRVDVRQWARRGYLRAPGLFSWSWNRGGKPSGSIGIAVHGPDALTLRYTVTVDDNRRDVADMVRLVQTHCGFGGSRQWFACPRCARPVAVLYLRGGYFGCRQCKRVAYSSQSEDALGRLRRQQDRIEARLGECWQRPKGMRRATYDRLVAKLIDCQERSEEELALLLRKLGFAG